MQARFQHTPRPSSDQFRQSSGIVERNFFHYMPFVFLILITIGSAGSLLQELAYHLGVDLPARRETLTSQHFIDLGDIRIGVVAPQTAWGMDSVLDLDPQHIRERIGAGYDDAAEQLTGFLQQPRES